MAPEPHPFARFINILGRGRTKTRSLTLQNGAAGEEHWPPTIVDPRLAPDESMDLARLGALWRGDIADEYAEAAVTGTLAIVLRALGEAPDAERAQAKADTLWHARDRGRLLAAA